MSCLDQIFAHQFLGRMTYSKEQPSIYQLHIYIFQATIRDVARTAFCFCGEYFYTHTGKKEGVKIIYFYWGGIYILS